uniref:Uncharacterized protein n=1 Tax=Chrysemys picta bellii TaxID=8478 RepID=A0A8C3I1Y7_CHRPI
AVSGALRGRPFGAAASSKGRTGVGHRPPPPPATESRRGGRGEKSSLTSTLLMKLGLTGEHPSPAGGGRGRTDLSWTP